MRAGSLFTGTAALDMAAGEVFGAVPAWFADLDPAAAALLAHRYPGVPNLRDIDWDLVDLLAPVEVVTAGWPCQPFSLAGKRKGADDDRALWPEVDRCVRALRPRYVLLENVPAVVGAELGRVADTLAAYGYRFAWVCLPASSVGAPHIRARFFLCAVAENTDGATGGERRQPASGQAERGRTRADSGGRGRAPLADADGEHERTIATGAGCGQPKGAAGGGDSPAADAARDGRGEGRPEPTRLVGGSDAAECGRIDWVGYTPAIRRWEAILGRPAPAPTVPGVRGGRVLNPELPEWMMGLPAGWITGVPGLTRAQQLKLAGNGVVWQQAVEAYRYLLGVLDEDARAAA